DQREGIHRGQILASPRVASREIIFVTRLGIDFDVKLVRNQLAARGIELVEPERRVEWQGIEIRRVEEISGHDVSGGDGYLIIYEGLPVPGRVRRTWIVKLDTPFGKQA